MGYLLKEVDLKKLRKVNMKETYRNDRPDLKPFLPPYSELPWTEFAQTTVGREYIENKKESKKRFYEALGKTASQGSVGSV